MISKEKLYAATDNGMRIIEMHYPEAPEAAAHNRKFKVRPEERTPSASIRLCNTKSGYPVWMVTDFGDEGEAKNPIEIHMKETGKSFKEAILELAEIFNITDELNRSVNRPDIRKQPATAEQEDGRTYWDIDQEFTERECQVMGPRVRPEHLKALRWYRANHIVSIRNREAVYKYPNENYPIFMRECWFTDGNGRQDCFYKIYEPLNAEKQYRFQYQPRDKKPKSYVNGLEELRAAHTELNEREEKLWNADPANEGKPYREKKLPEVIICSGERDSLCVRSLGYHPVWFNSETYQVSDAEWRELTKYAEKVYNIPDIDTTGRIKGTEMALKFIDIHTIWLPEKLSTFRDNRGKPRKDFRDWMEIYDKKSDFRNLLELAAPARFWTQKWDEKEQSYKYAIEPVSLFAFLKLSGFCKLKDENSKEEKFVRVVDNVVTEIDARDIRRFIIQWSEETAQPKGLRNKIITDMRISPLTLDSLPTATLDFSDSTLTSQTFHFPSFAVEVTASGMEKRSYKTTRNGRYVWESDIIGHNIRLLPDMFEITHPDGDFSSEAFDISVREHDSDFFRYLINSSRIYWRKELEDSLLNLSPEEAGLYRRAHKFDIAGPNLDADEIAEQKQCLINKIFTIGYMLHSFKVENKAWAPFVRDYMNGKCGQCEGGTGKSFMFSAISRLTKAIMLNGFNCKILKNRYILGNNSRKTQMVVIDNCGDDFPFESLDRIIENNLIVKQKLGPSYNSKYNVNPKFAFISNYIPGKFSRTVKNRIITVIFSDYYHTQSVTNDYLENRPISEDFSGKSLMGMDYSEQEWEADINFMMQCTRFYLSVAPYNCKIEPRIQNIIFRKYLRDMSDNFRNWAEGYFSEDGDNVDREIIREKAFEDYKRFSGVTKITMQKFTKSLRGFCYTCDYVDCLNPEELHTSGGRILRRIDDGNGNKVQKEMIYVRTKKQAETGTAPAAVPKTGNIFDRMQSAGSDRIADSF